MEEWIKRIAEEFAPAEENTTKESTNTQLSVLLASSDVDVQKMHKLLTTNGFPILDIRIEETKEQQLPQFEVGDKVTTTASVEVARDVMIKTPTMLYTVASAVLPMGYIGEVVNVEKDAVNVLFDANISVTASDRAGYVDSLDYYVETVKVPLKDLKKM